MMNLIPNALEELINIPLDIDPEVNHVTCNIVEYETNKFLGLDLLKINIGMIETIYSEKQEENLKD